MLVLFVSLASQIAEAQAPVVKNVFVQDGGLTGFSDPVGAYGDIPNSVRTVTVPAGTAFLTWSATTQGDGSGSSGLVRPVIGDSTAGGESGVHFSVGQNELDTLSGSWVTDIPGGTMDVKLQVGHTTASTVNFRHTMSWTLIVFPDAKAGVSRRSATSAWSSWSYCCSVRVRTCLRGGNG